MVVLPVCPPITTAHLRTLLPSLCQLAANHTCLVTMAAMLCMWSAARTRVAALAFAGPRMHSLATLTAPSVATTAALARGLERAATSSALTAPHTRCASTRAATQRQRDSMDVKKRFVMKPVKGDPMFREVWRKFQLKVHPDLFARFPELQAVNDASLKKLQGILNEAKSGEKTTDDFLKARTEQLEFFLRTGTDASFIRVPLVLRLPGGNCKHVLAEALCKLFEHAGLPTRFFWGNEYWGSTYTLRADEEGADHE
ncbi:DUF4460 domain-containing protein [archaeon]|nr:MAG: DUF4460 domain-containing protein [archaeon]